MLHGGDGYDEFQYVDAGDVVHGGAGNDFITPPLPTKRHALLSPTKTALETLQ